MSLISHWLKQVTSVSLNVRSREITPPFDGKGFKIWLLLPSTILHPLAKIISNLLTWEYGNLHSQAPQSLIQLWHQIQSPWFHDVFEVQLQMRPLGCKRSRAALPNPENWRTKKGSYLPPINEHALVTEKQGNHNGHSHWKRGKSEDKWQSLVYVNSEFKPSICCRGAENSTSLGPGSSPWQWLLFVPPSEFVFSIWNILPFQLKNVPCLQMTMFLRFLPGHRKWQSPSPFLHFQLFFSFLAKLAVFFLV